ncbi:MAG: TIGR02757 family protein [Bacteroidia bacterium]|nr:MAG: TIGR02757 family protein [Bacteroidia bacterium]
MSNQIDASIAQLLNEKLKLYQRPEFISTDPIQIPHLFSQKQDIEIAGFLTAIISWGNRKSILHSAHHLMRFLNFQPYHYVLNYSSVDNKHLKTFYYRTFQGEDTIFFVRGLSKFYSTQDSLEIIFQGRSILEGIQHLREWFLQIPHSKRSEKHLSDVTKGSAAKRINMFLRWMVRKDCIDLGIWRTIDTSNLLIPLDVHTARTAYHLGLINNQNANLKNVLHLTHLLKTLDEKDPVKYDFALFGMSAFEKNRKK